MLFLHDILDTKNLRVMMEEGYIKRQRHPNEMLSPLSIYNYTKKAQFDRVWNPETRQCRGLIVSDISSRIVGLPLKKFFNYEEHLAFPEYESIPDEPFIAVEKLDGSLFFAVQDTAYGLVTASRGSFASDQCKKGTEILLRTGLDNFLLNDHTYIFEVLYPENRIVLDYGDREELVLLVIHNNRDGKECSQDYLGWFAQQVGVSYARSFTKIKGIEGIKRSIKDDEEGFVLRFESGFRLKLKGDEYLRLHSIMTNLNARHIWEWMRDNHDHGSFIVNMGEIPDELYEWIEQVRDEISLRVSEVLKTAREVVSLVSSLSSRKEQAQVISKSKYPGVSFSLLDNNEDAARKTAYKLVKPKAISPFEDVKDM